jgi:hypothetical protein
MKQVMRGVRLLHQARQFRAQDLYLPIVEDLDTGHISLLVETGNLFIREPELLPFL